MKSTQRIIAEVTVVLAIGGGLALVSGAAASALPSDVPGLDDLTSVLEDAVGGDSQPVGEDSQPVGEDSQPKEDSDKNG